MQNILIRSEMMKANIKLYQVADAMGIADYNLSRKLRHELPAEEQERILGIIRDLEGNKRDQSTNR